MTKKKTTKTPQYEALFKVAGRKYEATGKTLEDAVFALSPEITTATGVLIVQKGEDHVERVVPAHIVHKLFGKVSGTHKSVALKYLNTTFAL